MAASKLTASTHTVDYMVISETKTTCGPGCVKKHVVLGFLKHHNLPVSGPKLISNCNLNSSKLQPEGVLCKYMRFLYFIDGIHLKDMYFTCFTLCSGPVTTLLLTHCTMTEKTFGYTAPSQAGSPFETTWPKRLESQATGPTFAML